MMQELIMELNLVLLQRVELGRHINVQIILMLSYKILQIIIIWLNNTAKRVTTDGESQTTENWPFFMGKPQRSILGIGGSAVCIYCNFWTADPFLIKINLMVSHHKPECLVERLDCCVQGQGRSDCSKRHWMFVNPICSVPLISLQPDLFYVLMYYC